MQQHAATCSNSNMQQQQQQHADEQVNMFAERPCSGSRWQQSAALTYSFSITMPLDMEAPPSGLAFMAVMECDLLYSLLAQRWRRRCTRSLRAARIPDGFPRVIVVGRKVRDRARQGREGRGEGRGRERRPQGRDDGEHWLAHVFVE